ncbi:Rop family plasmid primer RNA-binding protein [Paenibacillus sp. DMB20]|uniref:Rop family plasmid primer RNA-binding protein n=1 Tax=Paenibacillus sp. DMB20 TaxID=1642570 RepID=UPI003FA53BAD
MNRNPPYTEASVTKQEKTALNMARFIRSQTLTLLEKLNELDADEQADICESLHDHADELYRSCLARSVMTVKTSDTCSSRRRSQLVCKRMPGADKPVRARQRVLAGVGAAAMTQSRSDSGVYTGLTMRHQSRLY